MDIALITSAALLGLAGTPHCAAMCAAPCAAASGGQGAAGRWGFQLARVASYTAAGALAASSVAALATFSQLSPALRPLWTLLHTAALALGLWLLWQGRQPSWMGRWGRIPSRPAAPQPVQQPGHQSGYQPAYQPGYQPGYQPVLLYAPARAQALGVAAATLPRTAAAPPTPQPGTGSGGAARRRAWGPAAGPAVVAGLLWAAWPCGLLQSALLVAALTSHAASGAAAMASFAVASSAGLVLGPWAWRRWLAGPGAARRERTLARLGGALLAAGSGWALSHDLWHRVAVWCGLA